MYKGFDNISFTGKVNENTDVTLIKIQSLPWTNNAYEFNIIHNGKSLTQPLWFGHLTMLGLLHQDFNNILDLGCGDGMASHIFKFLGKDVTALEPFNPGSRLDEFPAYPIDLTQDYIDIKFDKKFDAIWCSHVLEHIRNPGNFLDKVFDDLADGGILALTVPFNDMTHELTWMCIGHYLKYTHSLLTYHLVSSGFDCNSMSLANYSGQIGIILQKKSNGIIKSNTGPHGELSKFFPSDMSLLTDNSGTWSNNKFYNWNFPKFDDAYDLHIFNN